MKKELQGLKKVTNAKILLNSLEATLKKIPNSKFPGDDCIHGFWFPKFPSIHYRLAIEIDRCFEKTDIPEYINNENITLIRKELFEGNRPDN